MDFVDRFFALWANYPCHYLSYYHRHCCCLATSHVWLSAAPCTAPSCRLPCPSLSPRFCSNSCLLSQWCPPTISSSVFLFFSCPQSFSASGFFPISQLFTSKAKILAKLQIYSHKSEKSYKTYAKPIYFSLTHSCHNIIKKAKNNKHWWGCGEKENLVHYWWECKLV